jgi:hypothetical protein
MDKESKEKKKQKSLDATRLGEIRYQTELTRTEKKIEWQGYSCGPQENMCAVLYKIAIAKINK